MTEKASESLLPFGFDESDSNQEKAAKWQILLYLTQNGAYSPNEGAGDFPTREQVLEEAGNLGTKEQAADALFALQLANIITISEGSVQLIQDPWEIMTALISTEYISLY